MDLALLLKDRLKSRYYLGLWVFLADQPICIYGLHQCYLSLMKEHRLSHATWNLCLVYSQTCANILDLTDDGTLMADTCFFCSTGLSATITAYSTRASSVSFSYTCSYTGSLRMKCFHFLLMSVWHTTEPRICQMCEKCSIPVVADM